MKISTIPTSTKKFQRFNTDRKYTTHNNLNQIYIKSTIQSTV